MAHRRIIEFAVLHHVQGHRLRHALDGQIAGQRAPVLAFCLDLGALEGDGGVLLDLQKVGRSQVVVPLLIVSADAGGIDADVDLRALGLIGV